MDVANCITDVQFRLGFTDSAGTDIALPNTWVTIDELYAFADEALKRVAYESGAFNELETVTVTTGAGATALPAANIFTLAAWLSGSLLRITPVRELWALDSTWSATTGASTRASFDAGAPGTITLYPNGGGTVTLLAEEYPAAVASGSSTVALPTVLEDWLSYEMIGAARAKESDARMEEIAEHCEERCNLYRQVIQHLFGVGA